jgi:threonine dehydrogenase-like Zn-dependent dehydrogenase
VAPHFVGERRIEERERPVTEPSAGELLLEVKANAICGTDRELWEHGSAITPGHEAVGTVVATGLGTTTPVGTLGVVYLMDFCGMCRSCVGGFTNQCLAKRADMGFTHDGGYGPYELVHETNFFPVDSSMDPVEATLLLDVMGTTGHAIRRARLVRPDITSVVVGGAGPIGLGVVAMSRILLGADVPVVVGDIQPDRLALAERLGARPVDLSASSLTSGPSGNGLADGADLAVDTTGAATVREGLVASLGRRGVLVCVGHGGTLGLDVSRDLIAPERAVLGSEYFPFGDLPGNLAHLAEHRGQLSLIVTHRFRRARLGEALELFFSGRSGKVVVVP